MAHSRPHMRLTAWIALLLLPASLLVPAGQCLAACGGSASVSSGCCCGPDSCAPGGVVLEGKGCCCSVSEVPAQAPPSSAVTASAKCAPADSDAKHDSGATVSTIVTAGQTAWVCEPNPHPPGESHIFLIICSFLI